jgi:uncharacterized protein YbjT (DUF2867 family)
MAESELNVVTGATGYTGKYLTRRLLGMGKRVKSLTGHMDRENPFGEQVEIARMAFDDPAELAKSLEGASTLYCTYWVRFAHGDVTFEKAIENTKTLIKAAEDAGVKRLVHVSIANPSEDSPLPYYHGKAMVEKAVRESKLSYAIIRPTVIFGPEDILINNIAYFIRKYPMFVVPGSGEYGMQPIYVEDMAEIMANAGQTDENLVTDAVGPEAFTFNEIVELIKRSVHGHAKIMHMNASIALKAVKYLGNAVGDVVLTEDEVKGLTANLLVSKEEPKGHVKLSEWLAEHGETVGKEYHSELARHYRA